MNVLNSILNGLTSIVLAPFEGSPLLGLIIVSAVCGVLMTIVFRYTSNQQGIRAAADQTKAMMMRMRLFKDDFQVALGSQEQLLKATGKRLLYSFAPMLVLMVPFTLILVQLAQWFEYRPLQTAETTVVELRVSEPAWPTWQGATLEVPDGVVLETPGLRDEQNHTVSWRVRVTRPTDEPLRLRQGDVVVEKEFHGAATSDRIYALSPTRPGTNFWEQLLYPTETAFAAESPVEAISMHYPLRSTPIFGFDLPWWGTFLLLSMVAALLAKPFVKVQF
jgi:uncharacterized membrane protein (DUF106 family)